MRYVYKLLFFGFTVLQLLDSSIGLSAQRAASDVVVVTKRPIAVLTSRPQLKPKITSGLGVPAGETFHLGERPSGDFVVSAYNEGAVPVTILATRGERREIVGKVNPGETVVRQFKSSDGVLVQNQSEQKAKLIVEAWGTNDLSMYYIPNSEEPAVD